MPVVPKLGRMIHLKWRDHMRNSNHFISTTTVSMDTKLGRMVTYFELLSSIELFNSLGLLSIKSLGPLITWSCWISWQTKKFSTAIIPMVTKLLKELPIIILHDSSIKWFCEVTWQVKYFICSLALNYWIPIMVRWWLTVRDFNP